MLLDELQRVLPILCLSHHRHAIRLPVHQGRKSPSGQFIVIHYQNSDHIYSFVIHTGLE